MTMGLLHMILLLPLAGGSDGSRMARVEAFVRHVEQSEEFEPSARAFVAQAWKRRQAEAGREPSGGQLDNFPVEALAVLSSRFGEALAAFEKGEAARAEEMFGELATSQDPYLAIHARVFQLKAAVENERLEESLRQAEAMMRNRPRLIEYSSYLPEVHFLLGYCLLRNLQYDRASQTLREFLNSPQAGPERMRVSARQIIAELESRRPDGIGDVADLTNWSAAALGHGLLDQTVVTRQEKALQLLSALIEEAEQREQQSENSAGEQSSRDSPRNRPQVVPNPSSPAEESSLVDGESETGILNEPERASPGETWGSMPPQERERILQSIRERFPARYRELIEQYYLELSKTP